MTGRQAISRGLSFFRTLLGKKTGKCDPALPWLPPLSRWSLRLRLCLFFLLILALSWSIAALLAWIKCKEHIDEFYDTQQLLFAKRLATAELDNITDRLPSTKSVLGGDKKAETGDFEDDALGFAVFTIKGEAMLTDGEKGDDFIFQDKVNGFVNTRIYGSNDPWRIVWVTSADNKYRIAVGQEIDFRKEAVLDMLHELLVPWGLFIPLLFSGFFWILTRELAPLRKLTRQLEGRKPDDTSPISLDRTPPETAIMVRALNSLFARIGDMLTRERAFISDAAHELRTPLTALRIQAEVAGLSINDRQALEHALEKMMHGIDKSTHLVEQLLTLSRLESMPDVGPTKLSQGSIDWLSLLDEVVIEHKKQADKKGIHLHCVTAGEPQSLTGYPVLAGLLLRNLMDNAVKYTPENGSISIRLDKHNLSIENSGPGVPDSFMPRMGERFARPPGQAGPGSGLGLSIAKRAAAINGLVLTLHNKMKDEGGGFAANIELP